MTIEETGAVMDILSVAYPHYYGKSGQDEILKAAKLWASMFADDTVDMVLAAVTAFIATDTKGFPPPIGAIKERIRRLRTPDELTELEAWALVSKALSNGIYGAEEEYARLPPDIRACIGSPSMLRQWAIMDTDEVQTVVASNFQRSYRVRSANWREQQLLPESVKRAAAQLADRMKMPGEGAECGQNALFLPGERGQ